MKMKTKNYIYFVLTIILLNIFITNTGYSQFYNNMNCPNLVCGMGSGSSSYNYPYFPMNNDTLKALVVFCNFPYPSGNFDITNTCLLQYWPGDTLHAQTKPTWADSVICPTTTNIWHPSLTGYFRDASMGRFWLIGDVYPDLYIFNEQVSYYTPDSLKIGYAVKELLLAIDNDVDFSEYDKFDPEDYDNDQNLRESDGVVDFIFIIFRFTNAHTIDPPSYTGIACLGGSGFRFGTVNGQPVNEITLDGKRIKAGFPGSGCISGVTNPWEIGISSHEFAEHYGYGYGHSELMGNYNINGGGIASAYDREHFGWNTTNAITPTSDTTLTLRDYVTTNDYAKIVRSNDTIYLENRRRFSYYSSNENIIWKWNCGDDLRPIQSDSMLVIYRNKSGRSFEIQSADGNWNWEMCTESRYKVDYYSQRKNFFFHDTPDRFNEYGSPFHLVDKYVYNKKCENVNIPDKLGYMGAGGDKNTCFDVDYNEIYSPWSNPPIPINSSSDSLTIEIDSRNQNGDLVINIYFTNITDAKPSKPTGLKVTDYVVEAEKSFHPKLSWYKNLEPDFSGVYKIYRGYSFDENEEPTYAYLTTITNTNDYPEYIDEEILLYYEMQYREGCASNYITFSYKVKAVDNDELESVKSDRSYISGWTLDCTGSGDNMSFSNNTPKVYKLYQNYPNPFNPVTNIQFDIPKDGLVKLVIYDILGREIKTLVNEFKKAGTYLTSFNGSNLASGIYFYRIQSGNFVSTKKMLIIK